MENSLAYFNSLRTFAAHCGVEQMVARRAHNPKAVGSSPTPATKKPLNFQGFLHLVWFIGYMLSSGRSEVLFREKQLSPRGGLRF